MSDDTIPGLDAFLAPAPAPTPRTPNVVIEAHYKSVQKHLAKRSDPDSLRDAEYLKRVLRGDPLVDDVVTENHALAAVYAAIAIARAAPSDMTPEQMTALLTPSVGPFAKDLPGLVASAVAKARTLPPLVSGCRGPGPGPDDIRIEDHDPKRVVDQAEAALASQGLVYVRGRTLVEVVRDRGRDDFLRRPDGAPVIVPVAPARLRELLATAARWVTWPRGAREWMPAPVPMWSVEMLIAREQWSLPVLEGIADAPVFRADGTILDVPGYDAKTRLLYDPCGATFPRVVEHPSHEDARRAYAELVEPFAEFPFVADCDRAATVALILSMIGRAAITGVVPMFLSTAPTPGSGKGLLIDVASIIATGRVAPKMSPTRDDEEMRKCLLALALESPRIVLVDNVEGSIGSPSLASALTAGVVKGRILGLSKTIEASLRPVWAMTGNNVQLKGDLGRRVVPIGLDPGVEHPEDRVFKRRDLLEYARAERPRLVSAALTVLRAYVVAGRPSHGKPAKGSFESWDALIRGAIVWASGHDPLGAIERVREQSDTDLEDLRALLIAWRSTYGDSPVTAADVASRMITTDALASAIAAFAPPAGRLDARGLGYVLRAKQGRVVGGLVLRNAGHTKRGVEWRVVTP